MEVKVNIIDTLFTTIPKNTVVASYTIDEDSVDLTMLNDQYSFNTANKTILTSSNVTSNNLKAINFTARNWVSGEQVEINDMYPRVVSKLQNKFNKPNTIYKVTKDLDLNHCVLTIPEGCTLQFDGGTISNGSLSGNFTKIIADSSTVIFGQQIHIEGSWDIADIYDEWFWFDTDPSYISNDTIKNILALSNDSINNTIHFDASRTYYFKHVYEGKANLGDDVRPDYWKLETEEYSFLRIFTGLTSNTHLIINNTLQMLPTNQGAYFIFHVIHKDNIEISGTGAINGDAKDHLYTDPFAGIYYYGEWGYGFDFRSCSNIVIRDITIGYCFGDGIGFGNYVHEDNTADDACRDVIVDNVKILYARRNGISLGGENYSITNVYFEGCGSDSIKGTAPKCAIDFENDHIATNPTGICRNCVMDSCKFKDNAYDMSSTIRDDWATIPNGTLITISNCNFTAPLRLNRTHGITFNSCHIVGISSHDNSITAWYASSNLTFNSCIFDELNPYLTTTAKVQGKTFNNCVFPEDTAYNTIFRSILNAGKAIKFSIPKPIIGEIEFKAIGFNSGVSPTYLPVNTTKYVLGNTQALTSIKKIDVYSDASSTPRYAIYRRTPVFSNINYSEDANNYNIYFTLGGELIGNPYTTLSDFNIFLKSNTRYIVIEAPVTDNTSSEGIYGGKWSEVSAITMTTINVSDIPSTVTFPNKDMYPASTVADLPTQLPPTEVGKEVFLLDDSYKLPAFWDSYSNTFRDADGNKILGRTVGLKADLDALAAKLTTSDRGYKVYYSSYAANLTWSGTEWLNVDGSRYETTRIIRDKASALTWSQVLGFENLTYIIVGDIDLGGEELVLGNNTILDFQGGSFSNGTISLTNTELKGNIKLSSITLTGSCSNDITKLSWFTDDLANDYSANLQSLVNVTKVQGTVDIDSLSFIVNTTVNITKALTIRGNGTRNYYNLNIGSIRNKITTANDIVILNITSTQVRVEGITFIGAYSTLDPTTGVRLGTQALVSFSNASNCTLRNCNFLYSHIGALFTNSGIANIEDNNFAGCNAGLRLMASPDSNLINNYFNTNSGNVTFSEDNAGTLNGVGLSITASSGNINVIGGKCEWNNKGMVIANSMGVAIIGVQFDWNKSGNIIYNQTSYSLDSSILSHSITGCRFLGTPADQHIYIRYWSTANLNVCGCTFTKNASDVTAIDTSTGANEGPESIFKVVQKQEADEYRTKIHINFKGNTIYRVVNLVNAVIQSTTPGLGQLVVVSADGQTLGKIGSCTIINNIDVAKGTSQWRETAIVTNNLSTDDAGLTYFDTDLNKLVLWNGTAWTNVDGSTLA